MSAKPTPSGIHVYTNTIRDNKPDGNQRSRTTLVNRVNGSGNLGYLQALILEYALKHADTFAPSDIVVYARSTYGVELDRRRVHDALKRLVARNMLVKARRGLYKLSGRVDISSKDLGIMVEKKVKDNNFASRGVLCGVGGLFSRGFVSGGVVRVHGVGVGGLVEFYFSVVFMREVAGVVARGVEGYLRGLGFSRGFLRGVRRVARGLAWRVSLGGFVVGGHSVYGRGVSRPLAPVSYVERVRAREVGVDIAVPDGVELPRIHVKFYTARSPYRAGSRSLLEYLKPGATATRG